jgi:hypothetical protein
MDPRLTRGLRIQIMLSPEELIVVDDFRFRERMPSRAAAVRELFRLGLQAGGSAISHRRKSSDFSVIDPPETRSRPDRRSELGR